MKSWLVGVALAASFVVSHAFGAEITVTDAQRATQRGAWSEAIADWQHLYLKGEPEAPAALCILYFDGREGGFDAGRAIDWCRRAAGGGSAEALYRMGLLYLVGLGVDQDANQAQALCAAAIARHDPAVPAGFCLAAASRENEQAGQQMLRVPTAPLPALEASDARATSPQEKCEATFTAAAFDAAAAAGACSKSAAAGDAKAQSRLGLMQLTGVGETRNLTAADATCRRAETAAPTLGMMAFCITAASHLHQAEVALATGRRTGSIDTDPRTGQALPKTGADPFALDGALDAHRTTMGGLKYSCRLFAQWSLYEGKGLSILDPGKMLYGRRLADYRPADFADLDQAAADCIKLLKPLVGAPVSLDPNDSLLDNLALFRRSLAALKTRQAEVLADQREKRQDAALIATVNRQGYGAVGAGGVPYNVTAQENVCIDRVTHAWQDSGRNGGRAALEIRDTRLDTEGGRLVARGTATVVDVDSVVHNVIGASAFTCTFEQGYGTRIAGFQLQPGFSAQR